MNRISKREKFLLIMLVDLILLMSFIFFIFQPAVISTVESSKERTEKILEHAELMSESIQHQQNLDIIAQQQEELLVMSDHILPYAQPVVLHRFFNDVANRHEIDLYNVSLSKETGSEQQLTEATTATLALRGTYGNLIRFIRQLQDYQTTIEIPSINFVAPTDLTIAATRNQTEVTVDLILHFHMALLETESNFFDIYKK